MNAAALAAFFLTAVPLRSPAQATPQDEPGVREAPATEGPLDNDVFVPIAEAAAKELESGDQALARARAAVGGPGVPAREAERLLDVAFDHWRAALLSGGPGASTWVAETGPRAGDRIPAREQLEQAILDHLGASERRLAEGLHAGVVRRLAPLADAERARWTARLAAEGASALLALDARPPAERAEHLAELVRAYPGTAAAARAALVLGDQALEAGLAARARAWYGHAEREAVLAGDATVPATLTGRRAALSPERAPEAGLWERASACELVDSFTWNDPGRRRTTGPAGERWLRPGGAFASDGSFVVQTAVEVLLFSLARTAELAPTARLRPSDFLGSHSPELAFEAPREPPGWPLLPLADEHGLVLVVGRTRPGEPNALLALRVDAPSSFQELGLDLGRPEAGAERTWAVIGAERLDAAGDAHALTELEELSDYEFQPGPVASGDLVVVQARAVEGQVRSWLLAFDRRDGRLAWKRLLAAGADRVAALRFAPVSRHVASQPLLALDGSGAGARVFAGTHLGLGVLLDTVTGEPLWSFKNRRREEHARGWSGDRPLAVDGGGGALVLWAPMDSDRLYSLVPRELALLAADGGASETVVLARAPAPLGDGLTLVGGGKETHLVLGNGAGERTVSEVRAGADRVDALALARDERFAGLGVASAERAWACTNRGLYLFDRTRELYLLDRKELPAAGGEPPGGDLYAAGAHVIALGSGALWWFRGR